MASGEPVTSISTAPQKQLPEWVMAFPSLLFSSSGSSHNENE
jgi:hypothetical protein